MPFSDCIFDLYGTLADVHTDESEDALWTDAAAFACARGAAYDGPALRANYLRLCADEVRLRKAALPDVPVEWIEPELLHVFQRLLAERGASAADAQAFAAYFRRRSTLHLRPMPHAADVLDALRRRGARTFLLSNAQACFTWDELSALGLSDRFDGILLSSDAGMKKPYQGLYSLLLDRFGIPKETAVMIGNDAIADIGGAADAGLRSLYIHTWQSGERPASLPPSCMEIPDLSVILDF